MLFSTFEFILLFLPITLIGYFYLTSRNWLDLSKGWLLMCSLFFYSWWNPIYLPLILVSMIFNFTLGKYISNALTNRKKNTLTLIGVSVNIAALFYFKYANFFIDNVNIMLTEDIVIPDIILPLAISFFTFQQITYIVDSRKNLTSEYNFFNYGLFVTFFPQLIAGPIVHHKQMMPQFASKCNYKLNTFNLSKGIYIFLLGLSKKIIIADSFARIVNVGYNTPLGLDSAIDAWIISIAYFIQLYFDFSGYSDMAIGVGYMFNIKLPFNFDSPYHSKSIQEFWRKWHMTLSAFLKDYVYIPLGGSRNGEYRTLTNLMLTFVIGGIWHGAGWTFLVWGFMHGLALVIHRLWTKLKQPMPNVIAIIITMLWVNFAWVYFRAASFEEANHIIKLMLGINSTSMNVTTIPNIYAIPVLIIGIILLFVKNTNKLGLEFKLSTKNLIIMITLTIVCLVFLNSLNTSDFLYFDF